MPTAHAMAGQQTEWPDRHIVAARANSSNDTVLVSSRFISYGRGDAVRRQKQSLEFERLRFARFRASARALARHPWRAATGASLAVLVACAIWLWVTRAPVRGFELRTAVPEAGAGFSLALYQSLGVRLEAGHELTVLENGAVFDALERDIRAAKSSLNLLLYIWEKGAASARISSALSERARAGVACRIVVDDLGSPDFGRDVEPELTRAGCQVRTFRPRKLGNTLARNHRKLVIIDGLLGYTGGFGIRDNWLGDGVHGDHWRDTGVRFSGPAVSGAQQAFAENWQEAGGELLPEAAFPSFLTASPAAPASSGGSLAAFVTSTGSSELTRAERLTQLLIAAARRRIWIENAYFVPTRAVTDLLCRKAKQGVDVRLMVPGKQSDSKTSFGAQHIEFGSLLKHGVRVFEYQPTMLHAKTMIIDEQLALIGSINLDPLSLSHLEEAALLISARPVVDTLARDFTADSLHAAEKH
jgi:cardiolipin synthase